MVPYLTTSLAQIQLLTILRPQIARRDTFYFFESAIKIRQVVESCTETNLRNAGIRFDNSLTRQSDP